MVIILKSTAAEEQINGLVKQLEQQGVSCHRSNGENTRLIGLVGDTSHIDEDSLRANALVRDVKRVSEPYKAANRKFHPKDTVIEVAGHKIGGQFFSVIAGPCSVENEEQIVAVAQAVKKAGAGFLRGGAFKPRTSPYSFQGLHAKGIKLLLTAKKATGLPIVTELMSLAHLDLFNEVDIIQVGARNMQNFEMLKELGHCNKPILLKRGLANTIEELLMSAEYIMAGGNEQVILCERGIRTFEPLTRNTLDLSAIPLLQQLSHLPVIVDPSHAAGIASLVSPLSNAAVAVGVNGLMIEVHNDPAKALCDGPQALRPEEFSAVMQNVGTLSAFTGKKVQ